MKRAKLIELIDERIEHYNKSYPFYRDLKNMLEHIDLSRFQKETENSEKQTIQNQLIDADGLVELLDIDKEEAEKIIDTVKERMERWDDITLSDKVPKAKVFSLLGISYSTDPKKRKLQDYVNTL